MSGRDTSAGGMVFALVIMASAFIGYQVTGSILGMVAGFFAGCGILYLIIVIDQWHPRSLNPFWRPWLCPRCHHRLNIGIDGKGYLFDHLHEGDFFKCKCGCNAVFRQDRTLAAEWMVGD